ncbi:coagulation factor IX-like [Cylas formicarius]|uniref:coagulation factor IX-like n=1 Tax=Cylas formicarius TaxID=197179 RepID=UPI0029586C38|nr:coagulation factor IX-like [Cylas formicarius]
MYCVLAVLCWACIGLTFGLPQTPLRPRVINGQEVSPHSVPYQVLATFDDGHGLGFSCGGVLISQYAVLTAGHCVYGNVGCTVTLGVHDINKPERDTRQEYRSYELYLHEGYDDNTFQNDIGLVKLPQAAQLTSSVQTIDLPTQQEVENIVGQYAVVYGWGLTDYAHNIGTTVLNAGTLQIAQPGACGLDGKMQICTNQVNGQGSCYGDSGGPLVYNNKVIGIVSYGPENCSGQDVFTKVSNYLDWINAKALHKSHATKKFVGPRVINGTEVQPHSVPYQVLAGFDDGNGGGWSCGAVLLSEYFVLTAGHCIFESVASDIILGVHDMSKTETDTRQVFRSYELFLHEAYDDDYLHNDIGLVKLPQPAQFTSYVQPISLPTQGEVQNIIGQYVTVYGWGLIDGVRNIGTSVLSKGTLQVVDDSACLQEAGDFQSQSQICALQVNGQGACSGDSGGPLVYNNKVIGVVSYGPEHCVGEPDIFTKVSNYLDWIHGKMQ